jgi:hypothetical protein
MVIADLEKHENLQTMLVLIFSYLCVYFFILSMISFVKARRRLVQENYILNLDCVNSFMFFGVWFIGVVHKAHMTDDDKGYRLLKDTGL